MLYLVNPAPDQQIADDVSGTLYSLGVRQMFVAPSMRVVAGIHPLAARVRADDYIPYIRIVHDLATTGVCPDVTDDRLAPYQLTYLNRDGAAAPARETRDQYRQRVFAWFTNQFVPHIVESPQPSAIVASHDVLMIIAEHLTCGQVNRAILSTIPDQMIIPGAVLEYQIDGLAFQATRFVR